MSEVIDTFLALASAATKEEIVAWYNTLTEQEKTEVLEYAGLIIAKVVEAWEPIREEV